MKTKFPLDKNTFGSSKAAETLADILSQNGSHSVSANVSRFLTSHNAMLHQVSNIPDVHIRLTLINMIGDKIKNTRTKWPVRVESYAKNVAQAQVKRYRELDVTIVNAEIARISKLRSERELARQNEGKE